MKTSVTLSSDIVQALDQLAGAEGSRSAVIERILRQFIRRRQRAAADVRDLAILNRHSKKLNAEAEDILRFQTWPEE